MVAWLGIFAWAGVGQRLGISFSPSRFKAASQESVHLLYLDTFLALGFGFTLDATNVVLTFNRALIQQFHYFVSLRMLLITVLVSIVTHSFTQRPHEAPTTFGTGTVIGACGAIYAAFLVISPWFHKRFFHGRYISSGRASIERFSKRANLGGLSWTYCLLLTVPTIFLGFCLLMFVRGDWGMVNPAVLVASEPALLSLMGSARTHRYILISAPLITTQALLYWGLKQILESPLLVMSPSTFVGLILGSRVLLDLHMWTVFRHRADLQWARRDVLIPTRTLVFALAGMLLLEQAGIPVVTYFKVPMIVIMYLVGLSIFTLPSCYAIVFGKDTITKAEDIRF
ncbi:hypothetical protein BDV26DRAFT_292237 [Aspergillus bertholletiae]|uniref:Uncharacterized protein n=1 Tax=Aspergillus bertholletiae TaxID=1226010 RepID=A0A5N7B9K7_9EURO|nr:hypothetical protein BDV26DRAFT_292237 [Aspergillus bertholletiae]